MASPLPKTAFMGGSPRQRRLVLSSIRPVQLLYVILLLAAVWLYRRVTAPPVPLSTLGQVPRRDARNWGEYVAFGHAREKLLEQTDPNYVGLGERRHLHGYGRKKVEGNEGGSTLLDTGTGKGGIAGDEGFEFERHGLYGGAHWDWTTGIAGLGSYLGPLDMRKRSSSSSYPAANFDTAQQAGLAHYLSNAWKPPPPDDKPGTKHMAEVLKMTWDERSKKNLPLRDRTLGIEGRQKEAAELWTRVYGAFHGSNRKGAVQMALENVVRRVPVVVFVEGEDEKAERIREVFRRLRVNPDILIIDLSKRPDRKNVAAFLKTMTAHDTLPNIVIGGRCIGGLEDLMQLKSEDVLVDVLKGAGVTVYGSAFAVND